MSHPSLPATGRQLDDLSVYIYISAQPGSRVRLLIRDRNLNDRDSAAGPGRAVPGAGGEGRGSDCGGRGKARARAAARQRIPRLTSRINVPSWSHWQADQAEIASVGPAPARARAATVARAGPGSPSRGRGPFSSTSWPTTQRVTVPGIMIMIVDSRVRPRVRALDWLAPASESGL